MAPGRNGSASDSRSEGCVFKSRRSQIKHFYRTFMEYFRGLNVLWKKVKLPFIFLSINLTFKATV